MKKMTKRFVVVVMAMVGIVTLAAVTTNAAGVPDELQALTTAVQNGFAAIQKSLGDIQNSLTALVAAGQTKLVEVTNTSANPVPTVSTDSPANFPFAGQLCLGTCGSATDVISVPQTTSTGVNVKRLVLDEVAVFCNLPTAGTMIVPAFGVAPPADAAPNTPLLVDFFFPLTVAGTIGVSQPAAVRIFADPGSNIVGGINGNAAGVTCVWNLMGHLETKL
jgi:hypothetical protein